MRVARMIGGMMDYFIGEQLLCLSYRDLLLHDMSHGKKMQAKN